MRPLPLGQSSAIQSSKNCNKKIRENMPLYPRDLLESIEPLRTLETSREMIFSLAMKTKMMTAAITLSYPWMITTLVEESVKKLKLYHRKLKTSQYSKKPNKWYTLIATMKCASNRIWKSTGR